MPRCVLAAFDIALIHINERLHFFILISIFLSLLFVDGLSSRLDLVRMTMLTHTRGIAVTTAILSALDESRSRAAWKGGRETADAADFVWWRLCLLIVSALFFLYSAMLSSSSFVRKQLTKRRFSRIIHSRVFQFLTMDITRLIAHLDSRSHRVITNF